MLKARRGTSRSRCSKSMALGRGRSTEISVRSIEIVGSRSVVQSALTWRIIRKLAFGSSCHQSPPYPAGRVGLRITSKRSEEHTSELQSLMRSSYAVFCLKKTIMLISYQCFCLNYNSQLQHTDHKPSTRERT